MNTPIRRMNPNPTCFHIEQERQSKIRQCQALSQQIQTLQQEIDVLTMELHRHRDYPEFVHGKRMEYLRQAIKNEFCQIWVDHFDVQSVVAEYVPASDVVSGSVDKKKIYHYKITFRNDWDTHHLYLRSFYDYMQNPLGIRPIVTAEIPEAVWNNMQQFWQHVLNLQDASVATQNIRTANAIFAILVYLRVSKGELYSNSFWTYLWNEKQRQERLYEERAFFMPQFDPMTANNTPTFANNSITTSQDGDQSWDGIL